MDFEKNENLNFLQIFHLDIYESFDIQRFASAEEEGRTEDPSETKKQKARKEGHLPQSPELIGILSFLAIFSGILLLWKQFYRVLSMMFLYYFEGITSIQISQNDLQSLTIGCAMTLMQCLGPIFFIAILSTLIASFAQTRFLITTKKISPDFKKIFANIFPNLKKIFWSSQAFFNLLKSLAKVLVVFGILSIIIMNNFGTIMQYVSIESNLALGSFTSILIKFVYSSGIILTILAIGDYIFQYREHIESLKMTKQEVKEEFKEQEGNPEIKQKIRQLGQQIGSRRMIQSIPKADVIITNPTHYAVAVQYNPSFMNAPIVIAKGTDRTALKIREVAFEHKILIHENKPLARELYASVDIGDEIPYEFYQTIADILALVYTQKTNLSL